ncbi:MAG: flap endonuclease [Planctomycetota bacterium]|nr:MAG: flap endonuclease [Planctomycetota bacterium]
MARLHLVDATYELFRAYTALPSIAAPDGTEVGATYGLVGTLLKLLRDPRVSHVGCATDRTVESFRNALFPAYKSGEGVPEDLLAQFSIAEEAIRALGLTLWPMEDFEADDALASAAARYRDAFEQVVICSPDKDLAQCVEGRTVVLWDRRREKVYDEAAVQEKWGVPPRAIPDYLALVGDAADGIPGIPRWGAKSSAAVLSVYGRIEDIPLDPDAWTVRVRGARALAESLAAHREAALLYKRLATLRLDVPLSESPEELAWEGVPREDFEAFCARWGFRRLADRPHRWR